MSRILHEAPPLREDYLTTGAFVRALLQEYHAARISERVAVCLSKKPTMDGKERLQQLELADSHLRRQERVVLALVAELTLARAQHEP